MESRPKLDIQLLGAFRLTYQGQLVRNVLTRRLEALLAYLLIHRQGPIPRQRLAFLFWPDTREEQARTNLRRLLHQLKAAFPPVESYLLSDSTNLGWNLAAAYRLDVAAFEAAAAQAAGDINALQAACELYTGDLLPDLYDDWVIPERERLRGSYTGLIERLADRLEEEICLSPAIKTTQRLLRDDPLREETYLRLMRLHAKKGDRMGVRRAYLDCAAILRQELGVEPAPETETAYRQWIEPGAFPLPPTLPSQTDWRSRRRSNLPALLDELFGREDELSSLKDMVGKRRLVTLTGFGGVGKTRLALAVASELHGNFLDGAWWVDLAPLSDPALVPQVMVNSLSVPEVAGKPYDDLLVDFLSGKRLLLVLDNCEHLLERIADVASRLLQGCPELHLLATSRVSLRLPGETIFPIHPLPVPELTDSGLPEEKRADQKYSLEEPAGRSPNLSAENPSVQLFTERASSSLPAFTLSPLNLPAVVSICRRLDGIPLAIELAAGRVRLLSPEGIAARLDDAFKILSGGAATLPRHRALRATLDWSCHLLPPGGQILLNRLAVFAGHFSLEAAEEIASGEEIDKGQVFELLAGLVDHSLVTAENMDGDFYYRLHEVTRQYALERLGRAEGEAVRERHLAYYTRLAEQADPFLYRREQTVWLRRLDIELSNLRSALDWGTRQKDIRRLEKALCLVNSLYFYWFLRSCFIEGLSWIERAMEAAAGLEISPAITTKMFDKAASFAFFLGDYDKAKFYSETFLMNFQDLHDPFVTIIAQRHIGFAALFYEQPKQARWSFQEGLQKALEVGDEFNAARFLNDLGNLAASQGEVEQAYQLYRQELEVSLRSGDRFNLLYATGCLARASMRLGNMEEARLYTHESLIYSEELGYALGVAFAMETKAQLAFGREDLDEALGLWRKCLAIAWDRRYLEMVLDVLESLAKLLGAFGELHQSARLLGACHTARMEYRIKAWPILAQETVAHLGQIHRKLGDVNFNRAWEKGQQMTLEEMVRLALGENLLHQERVKAAEGEPSGGV